MLHTITFNHKPAGADDYIPLLDANGDDKLLMIEAATKTQAIQDPYTENFCRGQGNDCRVRTVT
jgi:hypothetical protein